MGGDTRPFSLPFLHGVSPPPHPPFSPASADQATQILERYLNGNKRVRGDESLRVSLYLDNAMCGNLHIFVIDFDRFDENSGFFQNVKNLADKVTRSQGGGYHMFYGINKVDFFCDARHFIYEWEPWDNSVGLTDKTQQLYTLIKDNFSLTRPLETAWHSREYKTADLSREADYMVDRSNNENRCHGKHLW